MNIVVYKKMNNYLVCYIVLYYTMKPQTIIQVRTCDIYLPFNIYDKTIVQAFEIDWNDEHVKFLKKTGFTGHNDEEIVQKWLAEYLKEMTKSEMEQETGIQMNRG